MLSCSLLQPEHPVRKTSGYLSAHLCKRKFHILVSFCDLASGLAESSNRTSVKSLYACCPISSNFTIKIILCNSPIYYKYTTLPFFSSTKLLIYMEKMAFCRSLHTAGVGGSKPSPRTSYSISYINQALWCLRVFTF